MDTATIMCRMDLNEIVSRNLKELKTFCTFTRQKKAVRDIPFDAPLYSRGNSPHLTMSMDTSQSGGVVGTPVIINHQNTSTYGKHISGTVGVGTQSNSSNMETIQIFVAYAHSTVSVTFSADVALQWKQVGMSINFTPQKKTTIIARGNATFKYNGQGYQTAGTV